MTKRIALRIVLVVALLIIGFVLLLRSCLSKYDERAAIGGGGGASQTASQFLVFEKEGKGVIFSLIKYDKTVSYSQRGGSINKSVNTTYYAQSNDLATAAKIALQKIKNHGQIKSYPVEIIGASGNTAWLFAGELMAYDPFTLTKIADAASIEEKNPSLKDKLIHERRYYSFDNITQQINFTAADGGKYHLNTTTLIATVLDDNPIVNTATVRIKELDKLTKQLREDRKLLYDRLRESNRLYREKQLNLNQYKDSSSFLESETKKLDKQLDSLDMLARQTRKTERVTEDINNRKVNTRRAGTGFSGMRVNCDTLNGRWYGLYTNDGLTKLSPQFDYQTVQDEAARSKLYTAALTQKDTYWVIADEKQPAGDAVYLQAGFLLNKETGLPFHFNGDFLIVHKDLIGNEGNVQLTRINTNGRQLWTLKTGLKEFYDWQLQGHTLVVTGTDNKNLGSGEVNLLLVINLQKGTVAAYDFFMDKTRAVK
ncbi:MAG: hypothetical protein IPI68_06975 [Chitinophagaceae bacterium]|nr:hypothetical protein [Chitinophagaceae bacterium]